jgi:hypothetical protein
MMKMSGVKKVQTVRYIRSPVNAFDTTTNLYGDSCATTRNII